MLAIFINKIRMLVKHFMSNAYSTERTMELQTSQKHLANETWKDSQRIFPTKLESDSSHNSSFQILFSWLLYYTWLFAHLYLFLCVGIKNMAKFARLLTCLTFANHSSDLETHPENAFGAQDCISYYRFTRIILIVSLFMLISVHFNIPPHVHFFAILQ